jgi:FlaA1/EpsC-like NDP-sugar epimerase
MAARGSKSGPITEWFRGRSVLVTGATGFMGKVLVEKLLRSCPDIATVYLLMRPKRGNDIRMRLDELLNTTVSCLSHCPCVNCRAASVSKHQARLLRSRIR